MADEDVLIFLSYAHDDDLAVGTSGNEAGFVTFLNRMLDLKLRDLGATRAKIWIDRKRISDGDLFEGEIDEGLREAELLLVVMSPNWIHRPYCRKELETFADLRRKAGLPNIQERMIVVGKGHVDRLKRPLELQGQEGFLFYARDDANKVNDITPFYNLGRAADPFFERRDRLAKFLQNRVDLIAAGGARGSTSPPPIAVPNGRTVFLSKPASDMKEAYARLAFELQGKGFAVVPDVSADLPNDAKALAIVKDALAKAEASVHLVGEKPGFAPEGLDTIVKLQLAQARERSLPSPEASKPGFRRIVWAPKIFDGGEKAANGTAERDPLEALARFDTQIGADKIDGEILSKFVEYLFQYLAETAPRCASSSPAGNKLEVYLAYHAADEDYVGSVAQALREASIKPRIPVCDSDAESRRFNTDLLAKCDAVTVCWANASEVWVRSEAEKLADWQGLGRKEQFIYRGLIAGPPPAAHKRPKTIGLLFPDGEFDRIVDLVEKGAPTRELLADFAPSGEGLKP